MSQKSIDKLDSIISRLEKELGVSSSAVDPDDPWAKKKIYKSPHIHKNRCSCGYLLTLPFEERCPTCYFQNPANLKPQFTLPSTEEILRRIHQRAEENKAKFGEKKPAAPAKDDKGGKGGKDEKKDEKKGDDKKGGEKKDDKKGGDAKPQGGEKKQDNKAGEVPLPSGSPEDHFAKALLKVGKILSVSKHPKADKLYVCEVDFGTEKRTVCAGLVKFFKPEELQNRLICAILNLKAKKLMGVMSEAMILAGEAEKASTLVPPAGSQPGDQIFLQGGVASSKTDKELSGDLWTAIGGLLKVKGGKATYSGSKVLVTAKGEITVPGLPDGSTIK